MTARQFWQIAVAHYEWMISQYLYWRYVKAWTWKDRVLMALAICEVIGTTAYAMKQMYVYRCLINCDPAYHG